MIVRGSRIERIVSPDVVEVEKEVNALGVRLLKEAESRVVASGAISQADMDAAIAHQSTKKSDKKASEFDAHPKVKEALPEQFKAVEDAKAAAKEAKSALIRATREYNKYRKENSGGDDRTRELWLARRDAKALNQDARVVLSNAEYDLRNAIRDFRKTPEGKALEEEVGAQKSLTNQDLQLYRRAQELVGKEVAKMIAEARPIAERYPVRDVKLTSATSTRWERLPDGTLNRYTVDTKQETDGIMEKTRKILPRALADKIAKIGGGVAIIFGGRGGSYNERNHLIRADSDDEYTLIHETFHALTAASKHVRLLEAATFQRRVMGKSGNLEESFADKVKKGFQPSVGSTAAMGYRSQGKYIKDDFVDPYQGRWYQDGYTEVFTRGAENLFGGGSTFRSSGRIDRDLMATTFGVLMTADASATELPFGGEG